MPLCLKCRARAEVQGKHTGDPEDYDPGDGLGADESCGRCGGTNDRYNDDQILVQTMPHQIVKVRDKSGKMKRVSQCMLDRLRHDEISDGTVPTNMPEYNEPVGAYCHSNWRGGCPAGGVP